ncbi:hypothetical protein J6590_104550, partial [Homalodisca vitripennis]
MSHYLIKDRSYSPPDLRRSELLAERIHKAHLQKGPRFPRGTGEDVGHSQCNPRR